MKRLILLLVFFSAMALPAHGQKLADRTRQKQNHAFVRCVEQGYESRKYQQDSLLLIDPVGDAHLIRKLDTIPVKLLSILVEGSPLPQADLEKGKLRADYRDSKRTGSERFKTGRTIPVDNELLLRECSEIMRSFFPDIVPFIGPEHEWSPEARRYLRYGFVHRLGRYASGEQQDFPVPLFGRSKLFLCLACGWTSRYCVTGREQALEERILAYPDRGVQIHDLFAESYLLNNGDIYLTFLTCENVLTGYPHRNNRDNDPLQRKLSYIRHDSKEIGDNYGAWYHFFGIALYALMRKGAEGVLVADTESLGSLFIEGPDRQEYLINHYGAIFGRKFRELLNNGSWLTVFP